MTSFGFSRLLHFLSALTAGLWISAGLPWHLPAAERSLAALLPADVGVCVEGRDIARHTQDFTQSELHGRIAQFPPLVAWKSENGTELAKLAGQLREQLGVTPSELWNGLLGKQAMLAVWPPRSSDAATPATQGGPGEGRAVLLLEATDAALLDRVLNHLVDLHRKSGHWKQSQPLEIGGQTCTLHVVQPKGQSSRLYLVALGNLGLMSNDEPLIRQVLTREIAAKSSERTLAELPAYQAGMARLAPDAALRLFLNPRPWDGMMAVPRQGSKSSVPPWFLDLWKAADYVTASCELGSQLRGEAFLHWDRATLSQTAADVLQSFSGRAGFCDRLPNNAWLVLAGRVDVRRLIDRFAPQLFKEIVARSDKNENQRRGDAIGLLTVVTLLSNFGPDGGICLAPAPVGSATKPDSAAFQWLVGMETQPLENGGNPTALADALDPLIASGLSRAAELLNPRGSAPGPQIQRTEIISSSANSSNVTDNKEGQPIETDRLKLTHLRGYTALGLPQEAAYTFVQGYFLGGTSPTGVVQSAFLASRDSLGQSETFRRRMSPRLDAPSHLLYLDLAALRRLLTTSPEILAPLAPKDMDRATKKRTLDTLVSLLRLADSFLAAVQIDESSIRLSVGVAVDSERNP
jgi:hypothetical protein